MMRIYINSSYLFLGSKEKLFCVTEIIKVTYLAWSHGAVPLFRKISLDFI